MCGARRGRGGDAATLIELIAVLAIIAVLSTLVLGSLHAGGDAAAVRSAQATLANLVIATRTRATACGRNTRLLLHISPKSPLAAERYLRQLAVQVQDDTGWKVIDTASLPRGAYLLPREPASVSGLLEDAASWIRPSDGEALRSSAFRPPGSSFPEAEVTVAVNSATPETWASIVFTPTGTTANSGDLVLAAGRAIPPGSETPIRLQSPDAVRGAALSAYGVITLIDDRRSF